MTMAKINLANMLAYEAPFLIEKLLKEHIVESTEEGEVLFTEVKKFLVLVHSDKTKIWNVYSLRIDEVWHQFILFTKQYMEFCQQFFDYYIPHSPSNAPESQVVSLTKATSFEDFQLHYNKLFNEPLPDVWYDAKSVTPKRRILNDRVDMWRLTSDGEIVNLLTPKGDLLISVNELALDALEFIARTGAFYVRELPGGLDDEEKVAIISTLIEYNLLRVGS
jgi:hypothetical protein